MIYDRSCNNRLALREDRRYSVFPEVYYLNNFLNAG